MKFNRAFIVIIIVLMAVILLFEISAPNRFSWDDYSQSSNSKNPFGCYVMDSVLKASLPQGYEVLGAGIRQYVGPRRGDEKHTFLFTDNYDSFIQNNSFSVDMPQLIEEGNNIILATFFNYNDYDHYDAGELGKELGFFFMTQDYYSSNNNSKHINKEDLSKYAHYEKINWHADSLFDSTTYVINKAFFNKGVTLSNSYRILASSDYQESYNSAYDDEDDDEFSIAVAGIRDYGKGKVVVVSMPMLFTNYGILNDTIRPFVLRLLSECGDLPVVRYDRTHSDEGVVNEAEQGSPLRYLLSHRPLRWAFYLALATLVALVVFSAKRRQRVIPVIKAPVNHMMDFVRQIGGIYYKRHDNVDLLIKKYATFSHSVRAKTMIDMNDYDNIEQELQLLSNRTGIPFKELKEQIFDVWNATHANKLSNKRLKQLIDSMNNILQKINI